MTTPSRPSPPPLPQPEKAVQNAILRYLATRPDVRCWRNNTGAGVPMAVVRAAVDALSGGRASAALGILRRGGVVHFGVTGQADISGILADGRRLEIEVKSATGRQREGQADFQAMIERFNGVYVLARGVEDVRAALGHPGVDA